jgi:hypothetical protein
LNTSQNTPPDPRERLVVVGNRVLDALYALEVNSSVFRELAAAKDDRDLLSELMSRDGAVEALIGQMQRQGEYKEAMTEYVTIRQTIEGLTGAGVFR